LYSYISQMHDQCRLRLFSATGLVLLPQTAITYSWEISYSDTIQAKPFLAFKCAKQCWKLCLITLYSFITA